jgi:hypothetical protein
MNKSKRDFRAPWQNPITREEWDKFLSTNYRYARNEAYQEIRKEIKKSKNLSFLEIGFGNTYDFDHCFKQLHDSGQIKYTGFEITEQFVNFANEKYNDKYDFRLANFTDIKDSYDITYTRHVLEHQDPNNAYDYFKTLLQKTKRLCIVTWFATPKQKERLNWCERDGFGHTGAWVNMYSKPRILNIIAGQKFKLEIIKVRWRRRYNELYIMRKK